LIIFISVRRIAETGLIASKQWGNT